MKKTISKKLLAALLAFALAIVGLDQLTKALVRANVPYGETVPVLPGVVHLTHVQNTGAAFSMFSGARWIFLALVVVFLAVLGIMIKKGLLRRKPELWCMAAIAGGAVGNAIDRAVFGSVTDMIEVEFVQFAVFNVADSFITCGVIAFVIYLIFFPDKEKKAAAELPDKPAPSAEALPGGAAAQEASETPAKQESDNAAES